MRFKAFTAPRKIIKAIINQKLGLLTIESESLNAVPMHLIISNFIFWIEKYKVCLKTLIFESNIFSQVHLTALELLISLYLHEGPQSIATSVRLFMNWFVKSASDSLFLNDWHSLKLPLSKISIPSLL